MARFAIDTVDAAQSTLIDEENPGMGPIVIRVGFHSGPLVAHVVGTRTPHFTILGGTYIMQSLISSMQEANPLVLSLLLADTVSTYIFAIASLLFCQTS